MPTTYTSLLGLALPASGELTGTWGATVNDSITELVEDSIAATATASVAAGNWTLTTTGSGAANEARCAVLIPTGAPGVSRNIVAPSQSKAYVVINQSDAVVVLKGAATTGVTIAAAAKAVCAWNGSDFVIVAIQGGAVEATQVDLLAQGDLRLQDAAGNQYVGLQAPATVATSFTLTMPGADGTANQVLTTNGAGVLSFGTPSTTNVPEGTNLYFTDARARTAIDNTAINVTQVDILAQGDLRLRETSGLEFVALQAPGSMAASYTLTMPGADGAANQVLTTNGAGVLSFGTPSTTNITEGTNLYYLTSRATTDARAALSGTSPVTYNNTTGAIGVSTIPTASGGTGLTAPGASGNVLTSDGTGWVSSAPAASGISTGKAIAMSMIFGF